MKQIKNKKGMTLMELLAAMMVFAVISMAASALMMPILRVYQEANDLAEVNTLLDNLSAELLSDLEDAVPRNGATPIPAVDPTTNTINTGWRGTVTYYIDAGVLRKSAGTVDIPVLDDRYYKNYQATACEITPRAIIGGVAVDVRLEITHMRNGSIIDRTYTVRPIGMS